MSGKILKNILGDDLDDEFESILQINDNDIPICSSQTETPCEAIVIQDSDDAVVKDSDEILKFNTETTNTKVAKIEDFMVSDNLGLNTNYLINDFVYVRNEVVDMTKNGKILLKRILDDSEDEGFLKPGVLQAYSELNASLNQNLRLLMNMYEKIYKFAELQAKKTSILAKMNSNTNNNIGNQQINSNCDVKNIFALNSNDLLNALQQLELEEPK